MLESFHLKFEKYVIAVTSDGAAVMEKFGKLSPSIHQLCYNHAIHLAVLKVFYNTNAEQYENESDGSSESSSDSFSEDEEGDSQSHSALKLRVNFREEIDVVRKIVKLFKRSPVRNSILQKEVLAHCNKELHLKQDCKTRWNSLISMIERFLEIEIPIIRALNELNLSNLWENKYSEICKALVKTLKPVELAVKEFSKLETNLLASEGILKFLFNNLKNQNALMSYLKKLKSTYLNVEIYS